MTIDKITEYHQNVNTPLPCFIRINCPVCNNARKILHGRRGRAFLLCNHCHRAEQVGPPSYTTQPGFSGGPGCVGFSVGQE